jgi:hypothetical protein
VAPLELELDEELEHAARSPTDRATANTNLLRL